MLLLAIAVSACHEPEQGKVKRPGIEIRFPREGETVHHDRIPIWLVAKDPKLFARMTVRFNGEDQSHLFRPWGPRKRDQPEEALTILRPRVGENEIELTQLSADGKPHSSTCRTRQTGGPSQT